MENPNLLPKKVLTLKTAEGYVFVDMCEIVRLEAERNHTLLFLTFQQTHIRLALNITEFEKKLPSNICLFRCHRSHIVNIKHIKQYKEKTRSLITINGEVPISESNIKEFKEFLCKG